MADIPVDAVWCFAIRYPYAQTWWSSQAWHFATAGSVEYLHIAHGVFWWLQQMNLNTVMTPWHSCFPWGADKWYAYRVMGGDGTDVEGWWPKNEWARPTVTGNNMPTCLVPRVTFVAEGPRGRVLGRKYGGPIEKDDWNAPNQYMPDSPMFDNAAAIRDLLGPQQITWDGLTFNMQLVVWSRAHEDYSFVRDIVFEQTPSVLRHRMALKRMGGRTEV